MLSAVEGNDVLKVGVERRGCCFASDNSSSQVRLAVKARLIHNQILLNGERFEGYQNCDDMKSFSRGIDVVVGCRKTEPGRLLAEQVKQQALGGWQTGCGDPVHQNHLVSHPQCI